MFIVADLVSLRPADSSIQTSLNKKLKLLLNQTFDMFECKKDFLISKG